MISVNLTNIIFKNGVYFSDEAVEFVEIEIYGHAEFGRKGTDVVCSAVSILVQTMLLSLAKVIEAQQAIEKREGYLRTKIVLHKIDNKKKAQIILLLNFFVIGIFEIGRDYPENVEIKFS